MASIDKLKVAHQYQHQLFITWCITYYPQILFNVYELHVDESQWLQRKESIYKHDLKIYTQWKVRLGLLDDFSNKQTAVANTIVNHKKQNCDCSIEQAENEVNSCIYNLILLRDKFKYMDSVKFSIANLSLKEDTILKWHCPFDFVREYLHKQCGVNPKLEWFCRLFFKGKKYNY